MKLLKIAASILALASLFIIHVDAQTVQAGIFNPSGGTIEVRAMPSSALSNTSWAMIVTVRWQTSYGITLGAVTSPYSVAKYGSGTAGGYSYQIFSTVQLSGINWGASSENSLFTVPITGGSGTGTFEIVTNDAWTVPNNGDWYFESNSTDVTNMTIPFYQSSTEVPLPVQLLTFSGVTKGRKVELTWKTATEINSSTFEIERRSTVGWEKRGELPAAGTTNKPQEYTYVDDLTNISKENILYRLKTVDNDGNYQYSSELEISSKPSVYSLEHNFPNPFNPQTRIQYSLPENAKVRLVVFDMIGREVRALVDEEQSAGFYEKTFNGLNLSSGVYFYRITAQAQGKNVFSQVKKMLLVK